MIETYINEFNFYDSMEKRGILFIFLTAIISGFSIFVNKFGVQNINPFLFTGLKNILVAVFLFSIILLFKEFKNLKELRLKEWWKLALIGFVGGSIPFLLFFKGLQLTTAVKGAFIHKSMFIFVAILAAIFLKERISKKILIGSSLLLIGNALLIGFAWNAISTGDLLILLSTLLWAAEIIISKHALKDINSNIVAFGRMFFGSIFIIIFLAATGQYTTQITLAQIGWVFITSCFLLLYVSTFYTGLKYVRATVAASILSFGQIITVSLSYLFLNAQITSVQALGMLGIVTGIIFIISMPQALNLVRYFLPWRKNESY